MSDLDARDGISVTIKGDEPGGKYNDAKSPSTWIVFHGSIDSVKLQIARAFHISTDGLAERPLYDLVNEATDLFKAAANASRGLGARALPSSPPASTGVFAQAVAQQQAQAPAQPTATQPEPEPVDPILAALEAARSIPEVQQVWAENQAAFNSNPAYMQAYKTRGKALQGAA